jgi:REP element-mobilizing transposase RayT
MNAPERDPGRRSLPHHPPYDLTNQSIITYVTVNVDKRRALLNRADAVETILNAWREADHCLVGRYIIMPDHLHFFCAPVVIDTLLKKWMEFWRFTATRYWPRENEKPIWQKDFFDRQLRTGESYSQKWLYIWQNPIVAKFCSRPENWPWQGELNVLRWHEPAT